MKPIKPGIFILVIFLFSSAVCKAQKPVLKKGYAFTKAASYGQELRDFDGNPVKRADSVYFLYLEIKGSALPQITSVSFNGKAFTASVVPVMEKLVAVGTKISNGKAVTLSCSSGYSFWRIELVANNNKKVIASSKGIIVKGKAGSCSFIFSTREWTILEADIMG